MLGTLGPTSFLLAGAYLLTKPSLVHLGIDAMLLSAFLAGIKRTTGLTPALSQVPNKDIRQLLRSYLEFGEYIFDFAIVIFGVRSSPACPRACSRPHPALFVLRTKEITRSFLSLSHLRLSTRYLGDIRLAFFHAQRIYFPSS
ncbi:hypothetical protein AN958_10184 [Leucoagaricus sp. SymC.cos]|nr:hypothetical protein AN958_10184 [Leucoagaricus sp. SymC.cos]